MSTFSNLLRLEEMVVGEEDNLWGTKTTKNLIKILKGLGGIETIVLTSGDYTLTKANGDDGTADEASAMVLTSSSALSGNADIVVDNLAKLYIVSNNTTDGGGGPYTLGIKTTAGTRFDIPNGETLLVWCDGNDVFSTINSLISGSVALATNSLQLGAVVAADYAQLAVKNSWTNPQTVLGASIVLTTNEYEPDADVDTTMYLAQSEVTADFTIANPVGTPINGQIMTFHIEQHGVTVREVTWESNFIFAGDVNVGLTQSIDAVDVFTFQYNSNLARWVAAGVALNFPRS